MRASLSFLGLVVVVSVLVSGCAGPERKMGRGLANMTEIVRLNEMNRSLEQGGLFDGPDVGVTTGMVKGFNRTLARTGVGIYEIVTFPIPPYGPVFTNYLSPKTQYPDAYQPKKWDAPVFNTDHFSGFSGGDIAPWFPGSRFRVFDY